MCIDMCRCFISVYLRVSKAAYALEHFVYHFKIRTVIVYQMNDNGCVKVHIPHTRIVSESMAHTRKLTVTKDHVCNKN